MDNFPTSLEPPKHKMPVDQVSLIVAALLSRQSIPAEEYQERAERMLRDVESDPELFEEGLEILRDLEPRAASSVSGEIWARAGKIAEGDHREIDKFLQESEPLVSKPGTITSAASREDMAAKTPQVKRGS